MNHIAPHPRSVFSHAFDSLCMLLALWWLPLTASAYLDLSAATVERLDNGMTLIVLEEHSFPVVSVHMLYRVGARDETTGATGLAHFLEHMAFRDAKNFPDTELVSSIYAAGGEWHGYTWLDQTNYFETAPRDKLDLLLRIEADRMARLLIPEADVKAERSAVLTEMHGYENDPASVLQDNVLFITFLAHPYRNNTIGWESDVAQLSRADAVDFYQRHYHPGNAVLVVAGDVTTAAVQRQVQLYFAALPGQAATPKPHTVEPEQTGERRIRLHGEVDRQYFKIAYRAPGANNPDYAAFLLGQELLAGGSGVSFLQNDWGTPVRAGAPLSGISEDATTWFPPSDQDYVFVISGSVPAGTSEAEVEARVELGIRDLRAQLEMDDDCSAGVVPDNPSAFPPSMEVDAGGTSPGMGEGRTMQEQLSRATQGAVAEGAMAATLERARQGVLRELVFDVQTTEDAAHQLAFFTGLDALEVLLALPESVARVSKDDVARVLDRYLGSHQRNIAWYVPQAAQPAVAAEPAFAPARDPWTPANEAAMEASVEPADPATATLNQAPIARVTATPEPAGQPIVARLGNGLPLILQRSPLSRTISFTVVTTAAVFPAGVSVRQHQPIWGYSSLDYELLPTDLEGTIDRARKTLESAAPALHPAVPDATDPAAVMEQYFADILGLGHGLGGAQGAGAVAPVVLVLCGDIDPEQALREFEAGFGSLASATPATPVVRQTHDRRARVVPDNPFAFPPSMEVDAGGTSPGMGEGRTMQEQLSRATQGAVADDSLDIESTLPRPVAQEQLGYVVRAPAPGTPEAAAWQMTLYILSHGYEGRLGKQAISDQGLIYYIDSAYLTDGRNGWITLGMGVDPDKLPAMKQLLRETLHGLLSAPPSQQEVDEARDHLLGRYVSAAQGNRELADGLARQWFWFGHPLDAAEIRQRLAAIERQDVVGLVPAFTRGSIVAIRNPAAVGSSD